MDSICNHPDCNALATWRGRDTYSGNIVAWACDTHRDKVRAATLTRLRRNRRARERYDAMRSIGMVRTASGWE